MMRFMSMWEEITRTPENMSGADIFNLEMAGISYCDGSYRISRNKSRIYVFEYVISGKGFLKINSREFEPEAGDVYIAHQGSGHVYSSSAENPWTKIWFNVRGSLVKNLMETYGLNNVYHIKNCNLENIFREGLEKIRKDSASAHYNASLTVHEIIMNIFSVISARKGKTISPEALKLKNHLDTNVSGTVTLKNMGKLISKSPSQTIRIFKKEWGMTPYNYLLDRKIQAAKLLLANTMKTVKEIAYELGFNDEYYFSNIFKKKTGSYPSFYKRRS